MKNQARATILAEYSIQRMVIQLETIYAEVLNIFAEVHILKEKYKNFLKN